MVLSEYELRHESVRYDSVACSIYAGHPPLNSLSAAYPQPLPGTFTLESQSTCCAQIHRGGSTAGLIEHGAAGLAEARAVTAQAGRDGADVGDFAGAEPVDVGRAGPSLLWCACCASAVLANSVRNSPTVEARRARLLAPANRKNLAFMTSLLSALLARPALAGVCKEVGAINRGGCDLFHTGAAA